MDGKVKMQPCQFSTCVENNYLVVSQEIVSGKVLN